MRKTTFATICLPWTIRSGRTDRRGIVTHPPARTHGADGLMRADEAYAELLQRTREDALLASCAELLTWDEETYLPSGGVAHRANQLALLAGMLHDRATHPRVGELLGDLEGSSLLTD